MKASKQTRREGTELFRTCLVQGVLDESRARAAVQKLVEIKPRGYVDTISYFLRLVKLEQAQHSAKIESATALPADLQAEVQADLARVYGRRLETSFIANPALIGGMRIQVGSDVYDGSVRGRLAALEESL